MLDLTDEQNDIFHDTKILIDEHGASIENPELLFNQILASLTMSQIYSIQGVQINHNHADKKFDYPIYMENEYGAIVLFLSLEIGILLKSYEIDGLPRSERPEVGERSKYWPHTDTTYWKEIPKSDKERINNIIEKAKKNGYQPSKRNNVIPIFSNMEKNYD